MKRKTTTKRERELRSNLAAIRQELNAIETKRAFSKNSKLVGKCFKYENSYGSGSEKWNLYIKVVACDNDGLRCIKFEDDLTREIRVNCDEWVPDTWRFDSGYVQIPQQEFWDEFSKIIARQQSLFAKI